MNQTMLKNCWEELKLITNVGLHVTEIELLTQRFKGFHKKVSLKYISNEILLRNSNVWLWRWYLKHVRGAIILQSHLEIALFKAPCIFFNPHLLGGFLNCLFPISNVQMSKCLNNFLKVCVKVFESFPKHSVHQNFPRLFTKQNSRKIFP